MLELEYICVSVFTIMSPWRLNDEHTEHMYFKHISVLSIYRQRAQYFIYTAIFPYTVSWLSHEKENQILKKYG